MAIPPSLGRAALALAACAALASARPCSLWQIIDPEVSKFNTVRGNLNGYGLDLKGGFEPVIRGKILQTFDSTCPTSMSALDSIGFTLSSSASEPILVDYTEIKVGPAKISLSGLRGAMEAHHFEASVAQCGPDENYGGPCFGGTVSLHALTGNAHVLSHDIDLTGQTGQVEVRGYLEPDEEELRLQFTTMHINYQIDTAEAHGPFEMTGYLTAAAQLPFTFSFDTLRAEATTRAFLPPRRATAREATAGRLAAAAALAACAVALVALGRRVAGKAPAAKDDALELL